MNSGVKILDYFFTKTNIYLDCDTLHEIIFIVFILKAGHPAEDSIQQHGLLNAF